MIHSLIICTYDFLSTPSTDSPDLMTVPFPGPLRFISKEYNASWTQNELEQNYKDLYLEHTSLATQFGTTRPFARERTFHNLLNAQRTLEQDIKRLRKECVRERARLDQNLKALGNAPPADGENHKIEAVLRAELRSSETALNDILFGLSQSQDDTRTAPSDGSGTVRLMTDTIQLRVEKIDLLKRLTNLEKEKKETEKLRDEIELENGYLHSLLDRDEDEEDDEEKAQLRELLDKERAKCETLNMEVRKLKEKSVPC